MLTPEQNGYVVVAFTSTILSDLTVILDPGEHPEITEKCCVVFEETELTPVSTITAALAADALTQYGTLDRTILERIQEGLFESDEVSIEIVEFATDLI